eukprot:sb/3463827/
MVIERRDSKEYKTGKNLIEGLIKLAYYRGARGKEFCPGQIGVPEFIMEIFSDDLEEKGTLVLGQEQDSLGNAFDVTQAFAGQLFNLNVFNRALSLDEVRSMASWRCARGHGSDGSIVLSWGEIVNQDTHGKVSVITEECLDGPREISEVRSMVSNQSLNCLCWLNILTQYIISPQYCQVMTTVHTPRVICKRGLEHNNLNNIESISISYLIQIENSISFMGLTSYWSTMTCRSLLIFSSSCEFFSFNAAMVLCRFCVFLDILIASKLIRGQDSQRDAAEEDFNQEPTESGDTMVPDLLITSHVTYVTSSDRLFTCVGRFLSLTMSAVSLRARHVRFLSLTMSAVSWRAQHETCCQTKHKELRQTPQHQNQIKPSIQPATTHQTPEPRPTSKPKHPTLRDPISGKTETLRPLRWYVDTQQKPRLRSNSSAINLTPLYQKNARTPIYRDARGKGFCPVNRVDPPGKSGFPVNRGPVNRGPTKVGLYRVSHCLCVTCDFGTSIALVETPNEIERVIPKIVWLGRMRF